MNKLLLALILPVVALTGCATHYQKEGIFQNGYSDYRVADDRFVVTYRANEFTPQEKVMKYALKRAAELTLRQGFRYFAVIEQTDSGKHLSYPSLRLFIQCYQNPPQDRESIDAAKYTQTH